MTSFITVATLHCRYSAHTRTNTQKTHFISSFLTTQFHTTLIPLLLTRILQSLWNATQFSDQINVMDPKELGSDSHEKTKQKTHQKTYLLKIFTKAIVFVK